MTAGAARWRMASGIRGRRFDAARRLPREPSFLVVLLALPLVAVGCGGDGPSHDADKVTACLRAKGLGVAKDPANTFAPSSRDFVVRFPHGNVSLAFAPSQDAAKKVEAGVGAVAKANGSTDTSDVVRRSGNLVYWVNAQAFPAGLTELVDGCL